MTVIWPGPAASCGAVHPAGIVKVVVASLPLLVAVSFQTKVFVLPAATV